MTAPAPDDNKLQEAQMLIEQERRARVQQVTTQIEALLREAHCTVQAVPIIDGEGHLRAEIRVSAQ